MDICPDPAYPAPGKVRFACAGAGEAAGPTGSGALATLTFTALGVGTSPLTLSGLQLAGAGVPPAAIDSSAQGAGQSAATQAGAAQGAISEPKLIANALRDLSVKHGFEIRGLSKIQRYAVTSSSTSLTGEVDKIISKLLRNINRVIVRSAVSGGKIHRIVVLDPPGKASKPRSLKEKFRARQSMK